MTAAARRRWRRMRILSDAYGRNLVLSPRVLVAARAHFLGMTRWEDGLGGWADRTGSRGEVGGSNRSVGKEGERRPAGLQLAPS
eukprot:4294523-Pyramimonas_sp.AAC.1